MMIDIESRNKVAALDAAAFKDARDKAALEIFVAISLERWIHKSGSFRGGTMMGYGMNTVEAHISIPDMARAVIKIMQSK